MTPVNSGDLLCIGRAASVQFVKPIMFRVIRVLDWVTYDRWVWLEGYQLDAKGQAVERRQIFVQPAGLRKIAERPAQRRAVTSPNPRNAARPTRQPRRPVG